MNKVEKVLTEERTAELWAEVKKYVSDHPGGSGDLQTDGTLREENGVLGVSTPVQGVFTQEQFDALPEAERNRGLYVIPGSGGGSGGGGSGGSGEVYSTEETRIGTWIDGKPLYRQTIVKGEAQFGNSQYTIQSIADLNIDTVIKLQGTLTDSSTIIDALPFPLYGGVASVSLRISTGILFATSTGKSGKGGRLIVILEYTKTTDEAVGL